MDRMVIPQLEDFSNVTKTKIRKSSPNGTPEATRKEETKQKMGSRSLFLILTCAFVLALPSAAALRRAPELLRQVTDNNITDDDGEQYEINNALVGTGSERKFTMFMEKYGKSYPTRREYLRRLGIFAKNLVRAAEHQVLDPTAVHGVTPFSDLSEEEFEEMFLGVRSAGGSEFERSNEAAEEVVEGLPESFDWREKGAVTDVKMQVRKW